MIDGELEIFLVHPGGPFWKNKDDGAWSIPKGEFTEHEMPLNAALREYQEETGFILSGDFIDLSPVKLQSGKVIYAWALHKKIDASAFKCDSYIDIEWPPKSGKKISIPEVDRGEWFTVKVAKQKINHSQVAFIDELTQKIKV